MKQPHPYRGGHWEVADIGETGMTSAGNCGSGMWLKRGNLVPIPQLEQLPSNLRLRVHSVGSGWPFNTGRCQLVVDA